jgi:hypothetical protein
MSSTKSGNWRPCRRSSHERHAIFTGVEPGPGAVRFEAITNVAVGLLLAFLVQGFLYPALGIIATAQENLMIAAVFSALSVIRSYLVRRAFDTMGKA